MQSTDPASDEDNESKPVGGSNLTTKKQMEEVMAALFPAPRFKVGDYVRFRKKMIDEVTRVQFTPWLMGTVDRLHYQDSKGNYSHYVVRGGDGKTLTAVNVDTDVVIQKIDDLSGAIEDNRRRNTIRIEWSALLDLMGEPDPVWSEDRVNVLAFKFLHERKGKKPPNWDYMNPTDKSALISHHPKVAEWLLNRGIEPGLNQPAASKKAAALMDKIEVLKQERRQSKNSKQRKKLKKQITKLEREHRAMTATGSPSKQHQQGDRTSLLPSLNFEIFAQTGV